MHYVSSRGSAPRLGFRDVLLAGLARDGGLYLPETWPLLPMDTIRAMAGQPYARIARRVIEPFVGHEIEGDALGAMIDEAYATFRHEAVAPLVQIGPNHFLAELFHGPTLAFKDVAMQLIARLMDHVLAERDERATIIGATSGDTGGAAIEAFAGRARSDIFILFPEGRVSQVQRRQMTTPDAENVHAIAIKGNFDDCQALVKAMFNDHGFRDRARLSGVNSINWARIMAQIVYYFSTAANLGAPERKVSFSVPTGNFGDILAGYGAKRMGLPVARLAIATNRNDILVRALETGRYESQGVAATISPSMDIQISSNFERLVFEALGRDGAAVKRLMDGLGQSGAFTLPEPVLDTIRADFVAGRLDEDETMAQIAATLKHSGYLLDPHTAVGVGVAETLHHDEPMVTLATAHPAKFPDAVEKACGIRPALPDHVAPIMAREERYEVLDNDLETVKAHIGQRARVMAEAA